MPGYNIHTRSRRDQKSRRLHDTRKLRYYQDLQCARPSSRAYYGLDAPVKAAREMIERLGLQGARNNWRHSSPAAGSNGSALGAYTLRPQLLLLDKPAWMRRRSANF